jgi:Fur family ferric uptake transcriptional regulator
MPRLTKGDGPALLERFLRHLKDHRLPLTRQRERVAEVILNADDHLSVEQIQRLLAARGEAVGLATIYRTLDVLVDSGLVRAQDFGQGFRRFEAMPAQDRHEHLICLRCGRVEEFANERLERMLPMIADEHGFQPQRHRVEIYGVCGVCQRRVLG